LHKSSLTTDASDLAVGAVLFQEGKPITFISEILTKADQIYETNKKELLAIIRAFTNLRNYLYGASNIEIFTDHQPLSFSISQKNPNMEMKRWYSFIKSYSPKLIYKPGSTNAVADDLSIYATNKKELLAIIWAFTNLRNYLYGASNIEIFTDHQPLSFSISKKNPIIEMKRWYSFIESYSPKLIYRQLLTIYREFKLKTFLIYSLKIDINISGVSNSIICLIFPNILTVSSIAYLPVAISNSYLNWFKGLRVSCITFSRLLSAEC